MERSFPPEALLRSLRDLIFADPNLPNSFTLHRHLQFGRQVLLDLAETVERAFRGERRVEVTVQPLQAG
jgi:hypothetical protein